MTIKGMARKYISNLRTNMAILEFRLYEIDETRNYILEKIKHIDLMSQKYKKMCRSLKYCEHFLVLISLVS